MMSPASLRLFSVRGGIMALAAFLAILGASGELQAHAFQQPTTLKYALTVLGPLLVFVGATLKRPQHMVVALLIIAAPFASATASFGPVTISVLVPLLAVGFALFAVSEPPAGPAPALRWVALIAFPLLLIPLGHAPSLAGVSGTLVLMIAVGWFVSYAAADPEGVRVVLVSVAVMALLQGAIAIWQKATGHTVNLYSSPGSAQYQAGIYTYGSSLRPSAVFNDPIGLANAMAVAAPLIGALLLVVRHWAMRAFALIALALCLTALLLAYDRAGWIGTVLGGIAMIWLLPPALRRRVIPWVLAGVAILVVIAIEVGGSQLIGRVSSILHPTSATGGNAQEQGSAAGERSRLLLWSTALKYGFLHHPFSGVGIGNITSLELAHTASSGVTVQTGTAQYQNASSTYFQILAEAGTLGGLLLLSLLAGLWLDLRAGLRAWPIVGPALVGSVIATLVCWVTDVVVFDNSVAACVAVAFGLIVAGARAGGRGGRSEAEVPVDAVAAQDG